MLQNLSQIYNTLQESPSLNDLKVLSNLYDTDESLFLESTKILVETPDPHVEELQAWGVIPKHYTEEQKLLAAEKIYKKAAEIAFTYKNSLYKILKKVTGGTLKPKILVDVKSLSSFIDKVVKRGKSADKIHDILRSAILVNTKEDVIDVVKKLKKSVSLVEYEMKEYKSGGDFGYYGSHHFKIWIKEGNSPGIICEIQIMTKSLWEYKEEAHTIYDKYRSLSDAEKQAQIDYKKDVTLSKKLYYAGNQ